MKDTPLPPGAPPIPEGMMGKKSEAAAEEAEQPMTFAENLQMGWRLRSHFMPYVGAAIGLLILAVFQADLALTATIAAQQVIDLLASPDAMVGDGPGGGLSMTEPLFRMLAAGGTALTLAILMAAFLLVSQALGIGIEQIRTLVSERFRQRMQTNLVAALSRELADTRGKRDTGNTSQIFMQDASGLSGLLIFGLVSTLESVVKLGVYAFGLWRIDNGWVIVAVVFPVILLFQSGVARYFLNREARLTERGEKYLVEVRSRSSEFFENLSRLVYFKGERQEAAKLLHASEQSGEANRRYQFLSSVHGTIAGLTITLSLPLVIIAMRSVGPVTPGTIIQAQSLVTLLLSTLGTVIALPSMMTQFSPSMRRVEEILQIPKPEPEPSELEELRAREDPVSLEVRGVTFAYPGSASPVLHGLNLEVPPGACVGIVGASGCGKSTLGRLLLGDLQPTSGSILFDGVDVSRWHLHWRRELVGFMPAEPGFLRGTLEENVLFGRTRDEVHQYEHALDVSGVRDIAELPRFRDEGGMHFIIDKQVQDVLSTGERKRVAIARLLAGHHRLWIFDEPGNGLDARRMGTVARALRTAVQGRTSLIITHDPDVFVTDFVVFLENGRVNAIGPHSELLETNAAYRNLVVRYVHERAEDEDALMETGALTPAGAVIEAGEGMDVGRYESTEKP
jgi:ABC-type multidrug transport system fused ATPase/permease subunit